MCEVKYRAWTKEFQELYDWELLKREFTLNDFEDNDFVWQQYAGPKDSHGNEIYEGDILEAVFELIDGELKNIMDRGVVVKKDYAFQVKTFEGHHEPLHEWERLSEELKVIGNIYENTELLPGVTTQ